MAPETARRRVWSAIYTDEDGLAERCVVWAEPSAERAIAKVTEGLRRAGKGFALLIEGARRPAYRIELDEFGRQFVRRLR